MKNALILTTISGFVSQFELNDIAILQNIGYKIHYASNFQNPIYEVKEEELIAMGIELYHIDIQKSPLKFFKNTIAFIKLLKIVKQNNIHLIHCHNPMGGVLGRLVSLAIRKNKPKVIYTAHGFHFYTGAPILNWILYYPIEKFLAKFTDIIITINQEDYDRAIKFKIKNKGNIYKIPGVGIQTERFRAAIGNRNYIRNKMKIPPDSFFILSVGELNKNKNHRVILEAMALLENKNIYYGICGSGYNEKKLIQLAKKLKVENRFTLFGFRNNIDEILQSADCFAFPSKREGLGIAAIEAMAGGIPLITADCRGTREYMQQGETGYISLENNPVEYSILIGKMLISCEMRNNMSQKCLKKAKEFNIIETEKIMKNIYKNIM